MLGKHTDELALLVNAATQWRTAAATQGVALFQVNVNMPDGKPLLLVWDEAEDDWRVLPS